MPIWEGYGCGPALDAYLYTLVDAARPLDAYPYTLVDAGMHGG